MYKIGRISEERLEEKREHARRNPDGRTAELMGHIDLLDQELTLLREGQDEAKSLVRRLVNLVIGSILYQNKQLLFLPRLLVNDRADLYCLLVKERDGSFALQLERKPTEGITLKVQFIDRTKEAT